jgi:hypothetical protein
MAALHIASYAAASTVDIEIIIIFQPNASG